jgi:hypothetical protein
METLFARTKQIKIARIFQHKSEHTHENKGTISLRAKQHNQEI